MGIDIGASITVGVKYEEVKSSSGDCVGEFIEEQYLDTHAPYFDADLTDCVIGVKLVNVDYTHKEIDLSVVTSKVEEVKKDLSVRFGWDAKVYIGPDVW